jgi:multidrug efflux pump subunit AcrA (membrane-fusion protein)
MKTYSIIIGIIGLGLLALLSGCGTTEAAMPQAEVTRAQPEFVLSEITASGVVESVSSRNIYAAHGFMVDRLYVEAGDFVTEGQVLAVFDTENIIEDLRLSVEQQRAVLELTRINSENALLDAQRMLFDAESNMEQNTNPHILSAQAALNQAAAGLEISRRNYNIASAYDRSGRNPQVLYAENMLRAASLEYEEMRRNHDINIVLYSEGIISSEEMRMSENALAHLQIMYNDALTNLDSINTHISRSLRETEIALQAANAAHRDAQLMLSSARDMARQELEALESLVIVTEASANLTQLELALRQTELQLERILEDTYLTAPISGTVTLAAAREGSMGMGLMFIVDDTEDLRVITGIREYDISLISVGMEVVITSNATGGGSYAGVVSRINPAAIPNMPIVLFEVEARVTQADTSLRIGMNTQRAISLE